MARSEDYNLVAAIVIWCLCFIVYLIFAGTISRNELATALLLASLTTLWANAIGRNTEQFFVWRREALLPILRAVADVLPATLRTLARLLAAAATRRSAARTVTTAFHFGGKNDPGVRAPVYYRDSGSCYGQAAFTHAALE